MSNLTKENIEKMYNEFRATPRKKIDQVISEGEFSGTEYSAEQVQSTAFLMRGAHECDEDSFVEAVQAGELPPIKLNAQEQELLKGGRPIIITKEQMELARRIMDWVEGGGLSF